METDNSNELGAGANVDSVDNFHVTYLPLVDYEGKLLPIHFLSAEEVRTFFTRLYCTKFNNLQIQPPILQPLKFLQFVLTAKRRCKDTETGRFSTKSF